MSDTNGSAPYQATYMNGPINITVRLDEPDNLIGELAALVKEARGNQDIAAFKEITPKTVNPTPPQPRINEVNQSSCGHPTFKIMQVKKEGVNKGKWFKTCVACGKFLGFVEQ